MCALAECTRAPVTCGLEYKIQNTGRKYTRTHKHARPHTPAHMHTHAHTKANNALKDRHACTHACTCMHTHACIHTHAHTHTRTHADACMQAHPLCTHTRRRAASPHQARTSRSRARCCRPTSEGRQETHWGLPPMLPNSCRQVSQGYQVGTNMPAYFTYVLQQGGAMMPGGHA